jgi:hypothetical protein
MLVQSVLSQAKAAPRPPVVCASSLGGHAALLAACAIEAFRARRQHEALLQQTPNSNLSPPQIAAVV